jgi:hypothetical protein
MHQSMFLRELKCNLQSGEPVVLCNSADNYSFTSQDEAQGFHWNNAQATIQSLVNYFREIRCFKCRAWESWHQIVWCMIPFWYTFMPARKGILNTKTYSASPNYTETCVISVLQDMTELKKNSKGCATCKYDNHWWLGSLLSVSEESNDMKISFLHPHRPFVSSMYRGWTK